MVVFPLLKLLKKSPEQTAQLLGEYLLNTEFVKDFNVVKGFLNLSFTDEFFLSEFAKSIQDKQGLVTLAATKEEVILEYSSPNTNKPLHLGHIRNNLLGYSVAEILKAAGRKVVKTQIINDRGIHICKSMVAWQKFADGSTPASTGLKGDKLVGDYYVKFDQQYKKEIAELIAQGKEEKQAEAQAPIMLEARQMLKDWEAGKEQVVELWKTMNSWVYAGFDQTYERLGVDFDKLYYESNTYLTGKQLVEQGLEKGVFYRREDGSVWCDLTSDGLDEKLVLRADGTAVYMTQDIGTAVLRFQDYPSATHQIYTVGNEQDYHFKVLFLILQKLGFEKAKNNYHLSYGMMELPSGKMKSREGTVVDADDLMQEMIDTARQTTEELGKLDDMADAEKQTLYAQIGLGALKYFILKVDPKKKMLFNPEESIDFNGNTAPFIQYTHARVCSIARRAADLGLTDHFDAAKVQLDSSEKAVLTLLFSYVETLSEAAKNYSPALIANYLYDLAKTYNQFYQSVSILREENKDAQTFRLQLSEMTAFVIQEGFKLLGIQSPQRM